MSLGSRALLACFQECPALMAIIAFGMVIAGLQKRLESNQLPRFWRPIFYRLNYVSTNNALYVDIHGLGRCFPLADVGEL